MQHPLDFYTAEKQKFSQQLSALNKKIKNSSLIRLLVFVIALVTVYFLFNNTYVVTVFIVISLILFVFLVIKHNDLIDQRNLVNELLKINLTEIDVLQDDLSALEEGGEFINHEHFYSYDIDLFGKGSFFQFINRTATNSGKIKLSEILTANKTDNIKEKQIAINELSKLPKWRQYFTAIAKMVSVETDNRTIIHWIHNYQNFTPNVMKFLPKVFSIISLILIGLVSFGKIPFSIIGLWFFIGLAITFVYFKKINHLYQDANKAKSTFKQYHKLLQEIENCSFTSNILIDNQNKIKTESKKASVIFMEFSKILDAFDQRNNMIFGVLGNAFLLWDLHQSYKIEKWIYHYHFQVEKWFEIISFFDAQNSLANYTFNHPKHIFPSLNTDESVINAQKLGHPLIHQKVRINNNFSIKNKDFDIITGANMAGKSTFLRTVSLNIVLSNIGLPVCAEKFDYTPIKLITSMRTSDSLSEESSYFFSELKRLKFIVDEMKNEKYFIILDEILKGTNSKDKAIGSKKFVEKLVVSGSTGIIATHDLSLCEIEQEYTQINNLYFDAEIINNELHFDYKLKDGVCKNMNASFLLKKMEIV